MTYTGEDILFKVNDVVTRAANEGVTLTVKGTGAVKSDELIFSVNAGGTLYLDADATYAGGTTVVSVDGGKAYISAGDFSVSNPVGGTNEAKYLLDHVDDQKENGLIEVTGGTFHGFNPEESYSEDPAMNFLAEGYSTKVCGIDQAGYTVYEVISVQDLSSGGTANSYIVSESGTYRFPATHKGNEAEPSIDKASIASAEVLWESFGTSAAPTAKDLISEVSYNANDGLVTFSATDKKGNALIAVKDSEGTILWSWHIWMTDAPQDQVYRNNAGIMMDRNLGATSATPGDGMLTHGLVYQWGRKDPFIMRNYNGDDNTDLMKSVGAEWPDSKVLKLDGVTEEEAVKNPMQLYSRTNNPYNWLEELDNYRWSAENTKAKTINDPCPAGYQVPYGGPKEGDSAGIWAQALGLGDDEKLGLDMGDYTDANAAYKSNANKGIDFASSDLKYRLMDSGTCWYPACGYLGNLSGKAYEVNSNDDWGNYWGCELEGLIRGTYNFSFGSDGMICLDNHYFRSGALSVRCQKITK